MGVRGGSSIEKSLFETDLTQILQSARQYHKEDI